MAKRCERANKTEQTTTRATREQHTRKEQPIGILQLQQTAGNQAVQRLLAPAQVIQRHVSPEAQTTGRVAQDVLEVAESSARADREAAQALAAGMLLTSTYAAMGRQQVANALGQAQATPCNDTGEPPVPASGGF